MARICSGVVPQQPPIIETPAATNSLLFSAMNDGVSGKSLHPPDFRQSCIGLDNQGKTAVLFIFFSNRDHVFNAVAAIEPIMSAPAASSSFRSFFDIDTRLCKKIPAVFIKGHVGITWYAGEIAFAA